jgi:allophanate hydrolase subunit 2
VPWLPTRGPRISLKHAKVGVAGALSVGGGIQVVLASLTASWRRFGAHLDEGTRLELKEGLRENQCKDPVALKSEA